MDGILKGVRLEHVSGSISCDYQTIFGDSSHHTDGHWGCGYKCQAAINLMKVTDVASMSGVSYYPKGGFSYWTTCQTPRSQAVMEYYNTMDQGKANNAPFIAFNGPIYQSYEGDDFMLQLGFPSAYCQDEIDSSLLSADGSVINPSGTVCADVYFVYSEEAPPSIGDASDFYISDGVYSWADAEGYCQWKYGTHLASISSNVKNVDAQKLCRWTSDEPCWLGLENYKRVGDSSTVKGEWSDGTEYKSESIGWVYFKPIPDVGTGLINTESAMVTGNNAWYQRSKNEKYRALCNKPAQLQTKYCCTATDGWPSKMNKCKAIDDQKHCQKLSIFCRWTNCESIGYCVDNYEDVVDDAELEMNKRGKNGPTRGPKPSKTRKPKPTKGPKPTKAPKSTKAPKCNSNDSQDECESVGCEWKTGNPPNDANDYLEKEFAANVDIQNGMINWAMTVVLCLFAFIAVLVMYIICYRNKLEKEMNGIVGYPYGAINAEEDVI